MKVSAETLNKLVDAIYRLRNFNPVQIKDCPDIEESRAISMAVYDVLKPFFNRREVALYEAAKALVTEYEEAASDD